MVKYLTIYALLLWAPLVLAEPYIAVMTGHQCSVCHTNPTGGGKRTEFGNQFAQQLAARALPASPSKWTGTVFDGFSMGGNARLSARQFESENRDDKLSFDVDRVTLYLNATLSEQLSFYLDQQVAPGGALNREAWALLKWGNTYLKAGKIFLPFGWRLEDDTAFIRKVTGVNFNSGDNGVELGFTDHQFNLQVAVTNGTGGAGEIDDGKLISARGEWIQTHWRVGTSALFNNTDLGERKIYGIFAGLKTGSVSWLIEHDFIRDEGFGAPDTDQEVSLIEANIPLGIGHNLKLSFEANRFDDDSSSRYRSSVVYELVPITFTQVRLGVRHFKQENNNTKIDPNEAFLQLHVFF
jgi:hypothetical protein